MYVKSLNMAASVGSGQLSLEDILKSGLRPEEAEKVFSALQRELDSAENRPASQVRSGLIHMVLNLIWLSSCPTQASRTPAPVFSEMRRCGLLFPSVFCSPISPLPCTKSAIAWHMRAGKTLER